MAALQSSLSNRSSSESVSSSTICLKCSKPGHISSTCTSEEKLLHRRYTCNGIGYLSRKCSSRSRQQPAESKPKSSNAVSSVGTGKPKLFSKAVIDGVLYRDALVDTGSAFSMVSSAHYIRLPTRPAINSFKNSAPNIVRVSSASAEIRGYIDVPLQIAKIEIARTLLVVTNLSFSLLIEMDVLQPHAPKMSLESATPFELSARVCDVGLQLRTNPNPSYRSAPAVACVAESTIVAPKSVSLVPVRLPRYVQHVLNVVIEPLNSTIVIFSAVPL